MIFYPKIVVVGSVPAHFLMLFFRGYACLPAGRHRGDPYNRLEK